MTALLLSDISSLPLFSWLHSAGSPPRRRRNAAQAPVNLKVNACTDCGAPISAYSRGRCRKCGYTALVRPVPEQFMAILRQLGSQGAARHFKASLATVTRWRRELDIKPHVRAKKGIGQSRYRGFTERPLMCNRDITEPGQAAEFLRRYGAVYRCDENGRANAKGSHWRRNYSVLSDDQIMATATRLGWVRLEF